MEVDKQAAHDEDENKSAMYFEVNNEDPDMGPESNKARDKNFLVTAPAGAAQKSG